MNGSMRGLTITLLCLFALVVSLEARAEVSAQSDRRGNYIVTRVIPAGDAAEPDIWTPVGKRFKRSASILNPDGDTNGDLWPTVAENKIDRGHPWVAWSRFNGADYDLAWSRWTRASGWSDVSWVERSATVGDDLDPDIAFDFTGRPHMIWWREREGQGQIYLSSYVDGVWLLPQRISDAATDSRYPVIRIDREGQLTIKYVVGGSTVLEVWALHQDSTITDDINPQIQMRGRSSRSGTFVYIRAD